MRIFLPGILLGLMFCFSTNAVQISNFHRWSKEGPGAKEHSISWIYENHFYLVNGYGFSPYQGVNSTELWSLDLQTKKWQLLVTKGDSPGPAARGVRYGLRNEILVLSMEPVFFGSQNISLLYHLKVENGVGVWSRINYVAETEGEAAAANELLARNSQLSSLVYNSNDDSFYSICSQENCDVFKIRIVGTGARISKVKSFNDGPNGRVGFSYGFSQSKNLFVLASGQDLGASPGISFPNDIWTLDLGASSPVWNKVSSIQGRRNPCFGFIEKTQKLVVWGGTADGLTSLVGVNIFDLNTSVLSAHSMPVAESERSSCFGAYDESFEQLLVGFGNSIQNGANKLFQDLWSFK